jgi:phage/plasmid primase-like uncharacterized protein
VTMVTIDGRYADQNRVALSLAEIQSSDPHPRTSAGRMRFACPLCRSAGRHLAVDDITGRWRCWRCQSYGIIRERWADRGETSRLDLAAAFGSTAEAALAARKLAERRPVAQEPPPDDRWPWRPAWDDAEPITYTPGAAYLRTRGIDEELAYQAGVRYADRFLWRRERCVIFPFRDRAGAIVAVNARFIDVPSSDQKRKTLSRGPRSLGAFMTPGALEHAPVVVVEGPADALSLAMAGIPALALVGTSGTDWLPEACAGKQVAVALDNDERGEDGSLRLARLIAQRGGRPFRCRPSAHDWNDELREHGAAALRSAVTATLP